MIIIFRIVELTGDITPDVTAIREAALIVTTPEKWDGVSRSWQTRGYVKDVVLVVIDEIHLLGEFSLLRDSNDDANDANGGTKFIACIHKTLISNFFKKFEVECQLSGLVFESVCYLSHTSMKCRNRSRSGTRSNRRPYELHVAGNGKESARSGTVDGAGECR